MKKAIFRLDLHDDLDKQKAMKKVSRVSGIDFISMDMKDKKLTVTGDFDPVSVVSKLRKTWPHTEIVCVAPAKEAEKKKEIVRVAPAKEAEKKKEEPKKDEAKKDDKKEDPNKEVAGCLCYLLIMMIFIICYLSSCF
ncbi:hypothetical protein ACHQM5_018777 [Ranunculus cassubicifolius]